MLGWANIYDDKRYTKVRMFVHTHGENVCSESYLSEIFGLNACQVFTEELANTV